MYSDFISLADFTSEELIDLLDVAGELKRKLKAREDHRVLAGQMLVMIFEKPSLRTRVTFETGIFQLGGSSIFIEDRLGRRETVPDVARNLERWVNGIVARTHSHDAVIELARHASIPVINALTDSQHPCQVLADAMTLREHRGTLDGLRVAFVGDGNNMFASWAELAMRFPFHLTLVCPEGYEGDIAVRARAEKEARAGFAVSNDPLAGVKNADVVYTDVWASMGQEDEQAERAGIFAPFQVNARMMAQAKPDALFMHCLPAHRGEEVTDEVIESSRSIVFDQAENRLHAQKAVLVRLMGN